MSREVPGPYCTMAVGRVQYGPGTSSDITTDEVTFEWRSVFISWYFNLKQTCSPCLITSAVFVYFSDVCVLPWGRHFEFRAGHVTLCSVATPWRPHRDPHVPNYGLRSVKYGHSVQYGRGLLHAGLGNGTPIGLTLSFRIRHEINDIIQTMTGRAYCPLW